MRGGNVDLELREGAPDWSYAGWSHVGRTAGHERDLAPDRRLLRQLQLDLHDGPLQELAAIRTELHVLREAASLAPRGGLMSSVDELDAWLGRVLEELRLLAVAGSFSRARPLRERLAAAAGIYTDSLDIELQLELSVADDATLSDAQKDGIERIVQTALGNVAQHSDASFVRVRLAPTAEAVVLEVVDDGIGFDVEEALERAVRECRLGLHGILERARLLGGDAVVDSQPGSGTTLRVVLPRTRQPPASRTPIARRNRRPRARRATRAAGRS